MNVIWITGLSGAGKTSVATELVKRLKKERAVIFLDGDELRAVFGVSANTETNHKRETRIALAMQYSHLCKVLSEQGFLVVIATISLFNEVHQWNRKNLPGYFELYLKVPIDELRRRDPKELYRRFDSGEINNIAGLDLIIDEPVAADWVVEYKEGLTISMITDELLIKLQEKSII